MSSVSLVFFFKSLEKNGGKKGNEEANKSLQTPKTLIFNLLSALPQFKLVVLNLNLNAVLPRIRERPIPIVVVVIIIIINFNQHHLRLDSTQL